MADQIWMRFGVVGRICPKTRQEGGFGNRSSGGGNFEGKCGVPIITNGVFAAFA